MTKVGDFLKLERDTELPFIQPIASDDKALEVGFYKTTSTNPQTGEQRRLRPVSFVAAQRKWDMETFNGCRPRPGSVRGKL